MKSRPNIVVLIAAQADPSGEAQATNAESAQQAMWVQLIPVQQLHKLEKVTSFEKKHLVA